MKKKDINLSRVKRGSFTNVQLMTLAGMLSDKLEYMEKVNDRASKSSFDSSFFSRPELPYPATKLAFYDRLYWYVLHLLNEPSDSD